MDEWPVYDAGRLGIDAFVSTAGELRERLASGSKGPLALRDGAELVLDQDEPVRLAVSGACRARLTLLHNARPEIICLEQAELAVDARDDCRPVIMLDRYARLKLKAYNQSRPRVLAVGSARPLVLAYDGSRPQLECRDMSPPLIVVHDHARPRYFDWPDDWEARAGDIYVGQRACCFEDEERAASAARAFHSEWLRCRNRYLASQRVAGAVPKVCPNAVDFRWRDGTVHLELAGEGNPRSWLSGDAHHHESLTEERRERCSKRFLD